MYTLSVICFAVAVLSSIGTVALAVSEPPCSETWEMRLAWVATILIPASAVFCELAGPTGHG